MTHQILEVLIKLWPYHGHDKILKSCLTFAAGLEGATRWLSEVLSCGPDSSSLTSREGTGEEHLS